MATDGVERAEKMEMTASASKYTRMDEEDGARSREKSRERFARDAVIDSATCASRPRLARSMIGDRTDH